MNKLFKITLAFALALSYFGVNAQNTPLINNATNVKSTGSTVTQ